MIRYGEKYFVNYEKTLKELWENMKRSSIHIIWVSVGEERENTAENIFKEIIAVSQICQQTWGFRYKKLSKL